jgi:tRNA threonylcarbamoyladenosine biosynthesis protein TsaE
VTLPTLRLGSDGPETTRAVGAALATLLRPGDVVALTGELGAGKTCFVQGAARALGVDVPVTSPTFALMKTYPDARPPLVHVDVYRLDRVRDIHELGDDVLARDVVTFVEWGDAIAHLLPDDHVEVEVVHRDTDPAGRTLTITGHGDFVPRLDAVASACARWVEGPR